jgi:hypothetical protein
MNENTISTLKEILLNRYDLLHANEIYALQQAIKILERITNDL